MIYKNTNGCDDFKVEYTLIIPEEENKGYQLSSEEQNFLDELDEVYADIEQFTNSADNYDYALAVSSGIIAGFIDVFFVGEWNFAKAQGIANKKIETKVIDFAKKDPRYLLWCNGKSGGKKRDENKLVSAVEFLEKNYKLPGDNEWKFEGSGISAFTHHLDDFCHHPTLVGMICSILVQFTGNARYHAASGESWILPVTVNEYGKFVSDNVYGKIFSGIVNWFFCAWKTIKNQEGHLMSDMAGSKTSVKMGNTGAGVPGTIMSTLKEISALPYFKDADFAVKLRKAYQNGIGKTGSKLDLGIFNFLFEGADSNKVDMRTENAIKHELKRQSVPLIINEVVVRAFYFVRRFIEQVRVKETIRDIEWKKILPANSRTIERMLVISTGTFCVVDQCDAVINGAKDAIKMTETVPEETVCVAAFVKGYILKVNFVGVGKFAVTVGTDLYMGVRKNRLELAVASGEIAKTSIEVKMIATEIVDNHARVNQKLEALKIWKEDSVALTCEEGNCMVEFDVTDITIEELTEAASTIFSSTEEDFSKIKSEKWYQTIFYNLPFCQNGQKYVVKDIKSLAKLQQLFLELITKLDKATQQQFLSVIEELTIQRNAIAQTRTDLKSIYELLCDKIKGIETQPSLDILLDDDKKVLVLLLKEFKNAEGILPNEVQMYNRGIMRAIKMSSPIGVLSCEMIAELKNPKIIYRCFLEQCAVAGAINDMEWINGLELIQCFDIGPTQKDQIEKSVKSELEAFGKEYFYDKYQNNGLINDKAFEVVPDEKWEKQTTEKLENEDGMTSINSQKFIESDLANLQSIMDKYGIIKDSSGYKELATGVFGVSPDAYLGKIAKSSVYFTTQAVYVKLETGEWEAVTYVEVHPEGIINDIVQPIERGEVKLIIPDINEYRFVYVGSKEECDNLTALLYDLKDVKVSEYDKYVPTWLYENVEYAQILVDFLKLGQHSVIASLIKASYMLSDADGIIFEEFCKHSLSQYTVVVEDLKEKILNWKDGLDAHTVNLQMAILIKDLIEVLQLATGEPSAMTSVEKNFFDWLLKETKIEDVDEFLEMIRLPYYLLSPNRDIAISFDKLVSVEKYAHEIQMHIPYHILDNEKNGLWSEIYGVSQEYNRHLFMTKNNKELIKEKLDYSAVMELSSICASMYEFLLGAWSVEPAIIEWEEFESFIEGCILHDEDINEVKTKLLELLSDKDWISPQDEIFEYDRRNVGKKMIDELWQKK